MGITYQIDAEAGVILSVAEGEIGVEDFRASVNQFMADPLYTPKLQHLFDGRAAKFLFSGEDAQGYIRMYLGWRDGNHKIFHDMASAREWLGLPPEEG